jgi:hypothetical protein
MKTQFPKQFKEFKTLLDSFSERELNCDQIDFTIHDDEEHVPITHFFQDPEKLKSEFVCWGEKVADNLVLSWLLDGKNLDEAPIAMIDSEVSPVSVVALNPDDFLSMLPYGTRAIGSIAETYSWCLQKPEYAEESLSQYTDEYFQNQLTKRINSAKNKGEEAIRAYLENVEMYKTNGYNLAEIERPIDEVKAEGLKEGLAYLELLNWYESNQFTIAKNPFLLIKEAIDRYPNFFDRVIELGLPFQK